jgi:hypothetical protein
MGDECSTHVGHEKFTQFCLEFPKERDHSEDLGVDGGIIQKNILGK